MPGEETTIRVTVEILDRRFPDHDMLTKTETAGFIGVTMNTLRRYEADGKIKFNADTGRISKAELARWACG